MIYSMLSIYTIINLWGVCRLDKPIEMCARDGFSYLHYTNKESTAYSYSPTSRFGIHDDSKWIRLRRR